MTENSGIPTRNVPDIHSFGGILSLFWGLVLMVFLWAATWVASQAGGICACTVLAASSWFLGDYFVRVRRLAMPGIVLVLAFAISVGILASSLTYDLLLSDVARADRFSPYFRATWTVSTLLGYLAAMAAAWAHWHRLKVPLALSVLPMSLVGLLMAGSLCLVPGDTSTSFNEVTFCGGMALFVTALWWDARDPARRTYHSHAAFWLHLAAAPMLVYAMFALLSIDLIEEIGRVQLYPGQFHSVPQWSAAQAVMSVSACLLVGLVALVIDRRALLFSGLVYVVLTLGIVPRALGFAPLSQQITGLCAGSALLCTLIFWHWMRPPLVTCLPARIRAVLPPA